MPPYRPGACASIRRRTLSSVEACAPATTALGRNECRGGDARGTASPRPPEGVGLLPDSRWCDSCFTVARDGDARTPRPRGARPLTVLLPRLAPHSLRPTVDRSLRLARRHGLTPELLLALQVKDRTSGALHTTVLAPAEYGGQRYLVSMLGETSEWVRNLRAMGGRPSSSEARPAQCALSRSLPQRERPSSRLGAKVALSGRKHLPRPVRRSNLRVRGRSPPTIPSSVSIRGDATPARAEVRSHPRMGYLYRIPMASKLPSPRRPRPRPR